MADARIIFWDFDGTLGYRQDMWSQVLFTSRKSPRSLPDNIARASDKAGDLPPPALFIACLHVFFKKNVRLVFPHAFKIFFFSASNSASVKTPDWRSSPSLCKCDSLSGVSTVAGVP